LVHFGVIRFIPSVHSRLKFDIAPLSGFLFT